MAELYGGWNQGCERPQIAPWPDYKKTYVLFWQIIPVQTFFVSFQITNTHTHTHITTISFLPLSQPPTVSFQASLLHVKRKSGLGVSCESVPASLSVAPQHLHTARVARGVPSEPPTPSSTTSGTIKGINRELGCVVHQCHYADSVWGKENDKQSFSFFNPARPTLISCVWGQVGGGAVKRSKNLNV